MDSKETIIKEAKLTKVDNGYYLKLKINDETEATINISDVEQKELDKEYAKIIYYCLNNKDSLFSFEVVEDDTIDSSADAGVIAIVKEYITILNNELSNIYSSWEDKIEAKLK